MAAKSSKQVRLRVLLASAVNKESEPFQIYKMNLKKQENNFKFCCSLQVARCWLRAFYLASFFIVCLCNGQTVPDVYLS
jgi:hypothetical protein